MLLLEHFPSTKLLETKRFALAMSKASQFTPWFAIVAIFFIEAIHWQANLYSFLFTHDAYTQTFPWMEKVLEGWRKLDIPLWSWGPNLGSSLGGELQPGVFYPPTILIGLLGLSSIDSINIIIFIHAFVAAAGLYLCGLSLGSNRFLSLIISLTWAYYLLSARAFGQANLYYGYCYLSPISLLFIKFIKPEVLGNRLKQSNAFQFNNSLILGSLFSLSVLAGHTYASISALAYWTLFFLVAYSWQILSGQVSFFELRTIRFMSNTIIGICSFVVLTLGQLVATSEYFKLSEKWWGDGSTVYPHIVPTEVLRDSGVRLDELLSQFFAGVQSDFPTSEISMIPGANILLISTISLAFLINLLCIRVRKQDLSSSFLIEDSIKPRHLLRIANSLLVASLLLAGLSLLPTLEIEYFHINNIGAQIYKLIPVLNSVRLPGRLVPMVELGIILSMLTYTSGELIDNQSKTNKFLKLLTASTFIVLLSLNSLVISRTAIIKHGLKGRESTSNPVFLLDSDCDQFFRKIRSSSYGVVHLREESNHFPKNMGDISGYPRFTWNTFRSSMPISATLMDRSEMYNIKEVSSDKYFDAKCEYNGQFYYFDYGKTQEGGSRLSSFIANLKSIESSDMNSIELLVSNHSLRFSNPLLLGSYLSTPRERPFLKTAFFPGWVIKKKDGTKLPMVDFNHFLGFPQNSSELEIVEISYEPYWISFVYLQLFAWCLLILYFIARLSKSMYKYVNRS
jgi:hypothetical protein